MPLPFPTTFFNPVPVASQNFLTTQTVPSWMDVSAMTNANSLNRMVYDSTGKLTYAPNNNLTYSGTLSNAAWTKSVAGTGVAAVITDGFSATPPVAGAPVTRVQLDLGATPASAFSRIFQSFTTTTNTVISMWVKTNDGSTKTFYMNTGSVAATRTLFTADGTWQQVYGVRTGTGSVEFGLAGPSSGIAVTTSTSADLLVCLLVSACVTYETTPRTLDQVTTTSAAYYGPRFDFPNATAAGLLVEESRTNLLLQSNAFTTTWGNLAVASMTAAAATSPDGTTNAWRISTNGGTSSFGAYQSIGLTGSAVYTLSLYAKAGTASNLIIDFNNAADAGANFNLSTGSVVFTNAGVTATMVNVGNGWYRCSITKTSAGGTTYPEFYITNSNTANVRSWTSVGTENIYVYGAQLEQASFATSYIPTTTASVIRAADIIKLSGAALTAVQGAAWSAVVEAGEAPNTYAQFFGTSANALVGRNGTSTTAIYGDNSLAATIGSGSLASTSRVARSQDASGASIVGNAGTVGTSAAAQPTIGATFYLGQSITTYLDGHVRMASIYNSRLPDATLQTKSTVGGAL